MRKVLLRRILIASAFLAWPVVSFAHSEHSAEGFLSGFLHPALGLDHFLAMLAVGIVSAQLGGNRFWTIPCVFLASMIAGAIPGMMGKQFPLVEVAIGLSVVILGVAIVLAKEDSHVMLTAIFVSFFGVFSPAPLAAGLGVYFVSLGNTRWLAYAVWIVISGVTSASTVGA